MIINMKGLTGLVGPGGITYRKKNSLIKKLKDAGAVLALIANKANGSGRLTGNDSPWVDLVNDFGKNLFNKLEITNNAFLDASDGSEVVNFNWFYSDYIDISSISDLVLNQLAGAGIAGALYYDESKTFISGETNNDILANSNQLKIPINSKYLRFSNTKVLIDLTQLEKGKVSTTYESYARNDGILTNFAGTVDSGWNQVYNHKMNMITNPTMKGEKATIGPVANGDIPDWSVVYQDHHFFQEVNGDITYVQDVPFGERAVFYTRGMYSADGHKVFAYVEIMKLTDHNMTTGSIVTVSRGAGGYSTPLLTVDEYNNMPVGEWVPHYCSKNVDEAVLGTTELNLSLGTYSYQDEYRKTAFRNPKILDLTSIDNFFGTSYATLPAPEDVYNVLEEILALEKSVYAITFDPVDDHLNVLTGSSGDILDITGTEEFTICNVFKTESPIDSGWLYCRNLDNNVSSVQYGLFLLPDGGGRVRVGGVNFVIPTGTFLADYWHEVIVRRVENTIILKVNSVEKINSSFTANLVSQPHLRFGARSASIDGLTQAEFMGHNEAINLMFRASQVGYDTAKIDELCNKISSPYISLNQ